MAKPPPKYSSPILDQAIEVFGSESAARTWLASPQPGLDHRKPADLIETPDGLRLVLDLLARIEHGIYT